MYTYAASTICFSLSVFMLTQGRAVAAVIGAALAMWGWIALAVGYSTGF